MPSRRNFLAGMPLWTAAAALSPDSISFAESDAAWPKETSSSLTLEHDWQFRLDPTSAVSPTAASDTSSGWQPVTVPHTWQALGGNPEYVGVAWYSTEILAPAAWQDAFVRIEFEAVFHTAHVFLNGQPVGEHIGKGYTAFTCDVSPHLKYNQTNRLLVRVDNSYVDTMLPRMKSYDWANDGGITRPVHLRISPRVFIERLEIDASPDLEKNIAPVSVRAVVRNTLSREQTVHLSGVIRSDGTTVSEYPLQTKPAHLLPESTTTISLDDIEIHSPSLWHFDAPHLYAADVHLRATGTDPAHTLRDTFGIRHFEARGASFYLNGERVFLMGVERMAGSHPQFGMAEPTEWIDANHRDLKELNCVYTRVHWPQDRRILDFCDRHGILMQEEVPAWGPFTFENISDALQHQLEENGREQLQEMVARDRNHPCIVSWGLCNEVDGKNPRTRAFAHVIADEARKIDRSRLLTYASNTLDEDPAADMAGDFDFISTNEYYGSWAPGGPKDVHAHIERIRKAFPDKPIVVSEYGWCECQPIIPPGDENRIGIINGHTQVFRDFPEVAGAIYFDYNDYRTLVGDKGVGALRQRVHGVVDLYANRKPSFHALRLQSSPIETLSLSRSGTEIQLHLVSRRTLPSYPLHGYCVRWIAFGYDGLPMEGRLDMLDRQKPGDAVTLSTSFSAPGLTRVVVDILRPTGFSAATAELQI